MITPGGRAILPAAGFQPACNNFLLPLLLAVAACAQTPTAWTPELSMQVEPVGDVTPSPDGKLVAYTQSHAVIEPEKSEVNTQVFLAAADGSHRAQLTRGDKSATDPEFSPDGRYVYFSSEHEQTSNLAMACYVPASLHLVSCTMNTVDRNLRLTHRQILSHWAMWSKWQ